MSDRLLPIFRKEFGSYFSGRLGYFVLVIYAALSLGVTFYQGGYFTTPGWSLRAFFWLQPEIFTFLAPALTMRLWADERRYGTLELLLSQPVSYTVLVIGKFLAAWSFCLLMLSLTLPLWIYTAALLPLDHTHILVNYLFLWLVAGSLCAIGCAVSSLSANPVAAYLVSVFICWILKLSDFDALIRRFKIANELLIRLSASLNFDIQYESVINGQLSAANLIYFILLMLFALWINIVAVGYKRS